MSVQLLYIEHAKRHMCEFHQDVMIPKFGEENVRVLKHDTDSLMYYIEHTGDLTDHLRDIKEHFDFSKYPKDHPLRDPTNATALGKMKDEAEGQVITGFYGAHCKMDIFEIGYLCDIAEKITPSKKGCLDEKEKLVSKATGKGVRLIPSS